MTATRRARVWITRAQPGAAATAARIEAMGFEAVVAPLLEVRVLPQALDLAGVGALAFTSANGVRAFAGLSPRRDLPAYVVGEATGEAARSAGFGDVRSANGDVAALAALIAENPAVRGDVLHAAARQAAGDLMGDLAKRGVPARAVALYETAAADPAGLPPLEGLDIVLLHSPRAAVMLRSIGSDGGLEHLAAACLSPAVAAPLAGLPLAALAAAARPNEAALLELLATLAP